MNEECAIFQLEVVTRLENDLENLSRSDQLIVKRVRAYSLAVVGQNNRSLMEIQSLAKDFPDDGETQETLAEILVLSSDPSKLRVALEKWRGVAARSRRNSDRWYRAKYSLARVHYKLGDSQRASEILRYVQAIPPGFSGTDMQSQFESLLQRCQAKE